MSPLADSPHVVVLLGPSGAGKDTLLAYAREPEGVPVGLAHRRAG